MLTNDEIYLLKEVVACASGFVRVAKILKEPTDKAEEHIKKAEQVLDREWKLKNINPVNGLPNKE